MEGMKDYLDPELLSQVMRAVAAHRQQVTGQCETCGAEMSGTVRRRYCSPRCRQRVYDQKQRERRQENHGARADC